MKRVIFNNTVPLSFHTCLFFERAWKLLSFPSECHLFEYGWRLLQMMRPAHLSRRYPSAESIEFIFEAGGVSRSIIHTPFVRSWFTSISMVQVSTVDASSMINNQSRGGLQRVAAVVEGYGWYPDNTFFRLDGQRFNNCSLLFSPYSFPLSFSLSLPFSRIFISSLLSITNSNENVPHGLRQRILRLYTKCSV